MVMMTAGAQTSNPSTRPESTAAVGFHRELAPGSPVRRAKTGHLTNYDEDKAGAYTLPDPLRLNHGGVVNDAGAWNAARRPEILQSYEEEVFGRVPSAAPRVACEEVAADSRNLGGLALRREFQFHVRAGSRETGFRVHLLLPPKASSPVPLFLHLVLSDQDFVCGNSGAGLVATRSSGPDYNESAGAALALARGYGYAWVRYTDVEVDAASDNLKGVRGLALRPGQEKPAANEWGTISAWAWTLSRILDAFERNPAIDARRVGIIGHSRLGKTVLWAGATDPRFALVYASCAGEMGSALSRRDYGETVDDLAEVFPWWFAGNFQKFSAHWNDLPVDAHLLIALNAPHPLFITGGTADQWADPRGEFLAEVAAGPVYRLLGRKPLETTQYPPPIDTPLISGTLGFYYHTGPHVMSESDWKVFLDFADAHLKR